MEWNVAGSSKPAKAQSSVGTKKSEAHPTWTVQRAAADQEVSEQKTQAILGHVETLREEIMKAKTEMSARKMELAKRHSEFESAKHGLRQSQGTAIEPVEKGIRRTEHRWDIMHEKTAESRLFLCREAALLYGLQQRKRQKGGLGRDIYFIGGMPIADLRDLNSAQSLCHLR